MKNPLFYKRSNANSLKIGYAKRKLFLSTGILAIILSVFLVSMPELTSAKAVKVEMGAAGIGSFALLPFVAGIKGEGESEEDFIARKGEKESDAAFAARFIKQVDAEISALKNKPDLVKEMQTLKEVVEGMKGDPVLIANLKEQVGKMNLVLESLKEQGAVGKNKTLSLREQMEKWHATNKTSLDALKEGKSAALTPLTLKLNSPMTPSNTYNSSAYLPQVEYIPGIVEIPRAEPHFWDYIRKGRIGSAFIVWVNKKNPEGAAAFIAPAAAKPGVSFEIATENSTAKKIAASEKCAMELLQDIDGFLSWFETELKYQLYIELNSKLMTGTSSTTVPAGIQTISTAYTLSTVSTTNPNNWDAIRACVAQIRDLKLKGPITAFMNPIDVANMEITKAISQGQYLNYSPKTGATIVEDDNIPVGFIQVALLDNYKVLIYQDMTLTFGWEMDDFTKNLVTAICEMRIHQYFSENHIGSFIYDELADIKAAITAV